MPNDTPTKSMSGLTAAALALAAASPTEAQRRPSVAPANMQAIAPGLASYTDDVLFGDVWVRSELSPRDRSLVTLSVLIATGKTTQMTSHLGRGLDNGVKPSEIAGMVTQLAFYTGWPNAVSALNVVEDVFKTKKVDLNASGARAAERAEASLLLPSSSRAADAAGAATAPKLAQLTNDVVEGDLWHRTDLTPRDRSLVTIAALAASGDATTLAAEIHRGVGNGLTEAQIGEALTHLAFYAGWPKAMAAVAVASKVFADRGATASPSRLGVRVTHPGQRPVSAPKSNFTGTATVTSAFDGSGGARLGGATVTFAAGARTNWHTHPLGQALIVTAGRGWVQAVGEPVQVIAPGDSVWIAPGVKHWHGATRTSGMTHVALREAQDGETVTWLEPVTDEQYNGPR